ncbi:hypothetical protein LDENG_00029970 [Lucifuga dentata]|nr:hypothetical protein LDENG_00029970 [Lucifuga dentata]
MPASVKGLLGSCVVIPCSFNYPDPGKELTQFTGIWSKVTNHIVYHPVESKVMQQFRNRTELLGDLRHKNCSLKIDPLQANDTGPFHFRIEIANYNQFSYRNKEVSIAVIKTPDPITLSVKEEVEEGKTVSASCTAYHSCPTAPPGITWNHPGKEHFLSKELDNGQWELTSLVSFHPTRADHNKTLECSVTYKGGQHKRRSKLLKVKYPPEIKTGSACSSDVDMVTCVCIAESWPPCKIQFVLPNKVLPSSKVEKNGSVTIGTLQGDFQSSEFVHCLANNTQGNAILTLPVPANSKMQNLYTAISIGAFMIVLTVLLAVGVVKKCRGRSGAQSTPNIQMKDEDKAVKPPHHSSGSRKDTKSYINDHVYGNIRDEWAMDYDAIYANV